MKSQLEGAGLKAVLPRGLKLYIFLIGAAGLSWLAYLLYGGVLGWGSQWALTLVFSALVALGVKFSLPLTPKIKVEVTSPVLFASVLLLPMPLAMVVGLLGRGVGSLLIRLRWYNVAFNAGEAVLGQGLASVIYSLFLPPGSPLNMFTPLPASLAGAALYLENTVAVALASGLQSGKSPLLLWREGRRQDLLLEAVQYILGYTTGLLVHTQPTAIVLIAVPGAIVYFAFKDRMEKMRLNEELQHQMGELRKTQAQLIQAAKMASLGTMAAGVAHEINNPVFVISGNAQLLMEQADVHLKTEKARQSLARINEMAGRIARIVENLLSFSRNNEKPMPLDLHEVIDRSLDLVQKSFETSGVSVSKKYCSNPPKVMGRVGQLQQVVLNLVTNARDAMPQGGTLTINTSLEGSWVKASFVDVGEGIASEHMQRLFEPFFTTKGPRKGTGLGLYISRRIMDAHNGRIEVESQLGEGSTFTISLPLIQEPERGGKVLKALVTLS